ncbi:hypothetical protein GGR52DRAFT_567271 [Hypoxylon sp. FL1284]|nr:hypothetical protein GGR52DRAFT_567271 [Hypoxylon sp. FL1284]
MARTKATKRPSFHYKRTSWTRFHLPRGQEWPSWPMGYSDPHLGPLSGVPGYQKVWLGKKVEGPEQAALIILWESADALSNFQASPACAEFLQGLPAENDAQASVESGTLLRRLSLNEDGTSSAATTASSRFFSFQWTTPSPLQGDLQGRVTVTALAMPHVTQSWHDDVRNALGQFVPAGCEDLLSSGVPLRFWTGWGWVDTQNGGNNGDTGPFIFCEFRRWDGYGGATPEREEAAANSPLAKESWARTVAKLMPPVTAWEQERWDTKLAPSFIYPDDDDEDEDEEVEKDEEDVEFERNLEKFIEQQSS